MLESFIGGLGLWALIPSAFWILMILDCVKNERDRQTWLWILIFLNVPGAIVYFFACWLPRANVPVPNYFKQWTHQQKLWNAEAAVKNIGKAYQYIELGNVQCEIGTFDKAAESYQLALEKEPNNPNALWGCAFLAVRNKQFDVAQDFLARLIRLDPDYRCGEASLLYGRSLFEIKDWNAAKPHLESDVRRWSHPESSVLLAKVLIQEGNTIEARNHLESMIAKVKASPIYHYRRNQTWVNQAEKLLKQLR
ncbi:tetratricopeptide repeat protein [Leptolyngbya sp. AN03gr2]|uniref:tetratricopeptide repeat protein n=1 Tax=unclassified Leptolyngbya TaxID=2650499 RepID=UPI003D313A5B